MILRNKQLNEYIRITVYLLSISYTLILIILPDVNRLCNAFQFTPLYSKEEEEYLMRLLNESEQKQVTKPEEDSESVEDYSSEEHMRRVYKRFENWSEEQDKFAEPIELTKLRHVYNLTKRCEISPPTENHTATIIFLHGYAQEGLCWTEEVEALRQPYMNIICPTANEMNISLPKVKGLLMRAWYDMHLRHYPQEKKDSKELEQATKFVHDLIDTEVKKGIPSERIIIGGYSQGGALAIHAALSYNKRLGGLLALSSWMPLQQYYVKDDNVKATNKNIPILQCNIKNNPFIAHNESVVTAGILRKYVSKNHLLKLYTGPHPMTDTQMEDIKEFIKKHVPPKKL